MLIIIAVAYWSFADLMPSLPKDDALVQQGFSLYNAKGQLVDQVTYEKSQVQEGIAVSFR